MLTQYTIQIKHTINYNQYYILIELLVYCGFDVNKHDQSLYV